MGRKKKIANDAPAAPDHLPGKKKKPSYPKAMTIRYDEQQEKAIIQMMDAMKEKTMSKAFLGAPQMLADAANKVICLQDEVNKQNIQLQELREMVEGWQSFTQKLDAFINKKR